MWDRARLLASPIRKNCRRTRDYTTGKIKLDAARKVGCWPDGEPLGRGHAAPYLERQYADAILKRKKTHEGRPAGGWVDLRGRRVKRGDYIRFKVAGTPHGLCVRVLGVQWFSTFRAMINAVGIELVLITDFD